MSNLQNVRMSHLVEYLVEYKHMSNLNRAKAVRLPAYPWAHAKHLCDLFFHLIFLLPVAGM